MLERLKNIQESLLDISRFIDERIESDEYSDNEIVLNGYGKVSDLMIQIEKQLKMYSKSEFEILEREINSFIRSFENIFTEFELAVAFNRLMDKLFLSANETRKL